MILYSQLTMIKTGENQCLGIIMILIANNQNTVKRRQSYCYFRLGDIASGAVTSTNNAPGELSAPLTSGSPQYDAISALPGELHQVASIQCFTLYLIFIDFDIAEE